MRINVDFSKDEYDALRRVAERERRDLRDQIALLALKALAQQEEVSGDAEEKADEQ